MSDAIIIALITNGTIVIVSILSRLMSHLEHRAGERQREEASMDLKSIKKALNGKG